MENGEPFFFKEVKLLTLACRFVPYDQWLVTHVDSSWTIHEVKSWILAKCIANNTFGHTTETNLPVISPPAKPKTKPSRRPASPIVFAEFSPTEGGTTHGTRYESDRPVKEVKLKGTSKKRRARGRPISPITFAPIGVTDVDAGGEDDLLKSGEEGEIIGMGYEEDDEWDSDEEDMDIDDFELELESQPRLGRKANRNQYLGFQDRPSVDQQSVLPPSATSRSTLNSKLPLLATLPKSSYSTYHPNLLTLIRFSTGQILEKHYTILDYEIKPYELLEVHRLGVVTKLPRELSFKYIEPYWEGWVKALRVVFRDPVVSRSKQPGGEDGTRRRDTPADEIKTAFEGVYMTKSSKSHVESARRTMEVLAGGPVKVPPFSSADVALGLRPAYRVNSVKKGKQAVGSEQDLLSKSSKHVHRDGASLGRSSTMPSLARPTTSSGGSHSKGKGGKLEWRERWVFVKDGILHLRKENSETASTTMQMLPLDSLTEIRNADQLGRAANTMPITPSQRIVCAKFKTRMTSNKPATTEPLHASSSHSRSASQGNILGANVASSAVKSTSKSAHSSSKGGNSFHSTNATSHSVSSGYIDSNASSGSKILPTRSVTSSPPSSQPQIVPQTMSLSSLPSTSRVIQGKNRVSSLNVLSNSKGKGKAPAVSSSPFIKVLSESEVPSGPPSEAASENNPSEVLTDEDGVASEETDIGVDNQKEKAVSSPISRHPTFAFELDAESDGSEGTLSSPVFAHSETDSSQPDGHGMRSHGYGYSNFERRKRLDGVEDMKQPMGRPHSKHPSSHRESTDPESEWIVLDLGDDFALKSFLRVIHRHAPHVTDSSFLSTLPVFQMPKPTDAFPTAPAPTPAFTSPFSSPSQANPALSFDQWSWNTARLEQDRRPIAEEVSPLATPVDPPEHSPATEPGLSSSPTPSSTVHGALADATSTSSSINAPRDSQQFRLPPSPTYTHQPQPIPSLTAQSTSENTSPVLNTTLGHTKQVNVRSARAKNNSGTFGALPYPEWRLEIVTKAQRAGMGELTKAMDHFIWGDNPGLALLTKELGLSLAPMELIRSPSIRTAAGESIDDGESVDSASTRRQRRRRERKMTLEQENVAMGLDFSAKTISDPSPPLQHRLVPSGNSPSERSPTSTLSVGGSYPDSYSSLRLGYVDLDSSESGEESSDAEWVGWMADLHRQAKIYREEESRRELLETESVESSTDTYHYWDYQQQDDHRRYQEERKALEPTAIVTSSSPLTAPTSPVTGSMPQNRIRHQPHVSSASTASGSSHVIGSTGSVETNPGPFHRPGTPSALIGVLSSPSSNESLGRTRGRRLSFGLSPSDPSSSATSPAISQAGLNTETSHHMLEHSNTRLNRHQRQISGMVRDGPHLSHYASTGLIGTTTAFIGSLASAKEEQELSNLTSGRRPSMPTLNLSSSTALSNGLPPSPPMLSANSAGTSSGGWPADSHSATGSITGKLFDHPAIPRRASTTEMSLSRSSSMLSKAPGLLRKKDLELAKKRTVELEGEQDYERSGRKGKDKGKGKGKEYNFDEDVKSRRPRLSLSMSNSDSRQANIQPLASGLVNPPTSPILNRPIKSLLPSEDRSLAFSDLHPTRNKSPPPRKKKRGFVETAEKLLQGLESTLDFVDAR